MLKEAVILITGAGKGIGEAVVLELLKKEDQFPGLKLFLTSRTEADLMGLTLLAKSQEIECHYLACDLGAEPKTALDACLKIYGRVDVVIHSAGVGRFGSFTELTPDDLSYVLKTNVEGSFLFMQAVYAQMQKQELGFEHMRGQIQWVTSTAAETPFEQSSIYCMSKYAQRGLIEVMRVYGRRDRIRILDVKPGPTITPMWGEISDEQKSKMMHPKDVASPMITALLLASSASIEEITLRPIQGDL